MLFIQPYDLTRRNFNININEPDLTTNEPDGFSFLKDYNTGHEAYWGHKIYKCIRAVSGVSRPQDAVLSSRPDQSEDWVFLSPTNAYSAIDKMLYTETVKKKGDLVISLTSTGANTIFLQGLNFYSVDVVVRQGQKKIYEVSAPTFKVTTIREYMTGVRHYEKTVCIAIPDNFGSTLELTMKNDYAPVVLSNLVVGQRIDLGLTLADNPQPKWGYTNIEAFSRDDYGRLVPTHKKSPKSLTIGAWSQQNAKIHAQQIDEIKDIQGGWLPSTNAITQYGKITDPLMIYGILTDFSSNQIKALGYDESLTIEAAV